MCQLFGLSSREAVSPALLLEDFYCRGGGTDHHADGWGLAHFAGNRAQVIKQEQAAFNNPQVKAQLAQSFRSQTVMAHIRKATVGSIAWKNTHPFVRHLWGQQWVFAHNGDLKNYTPSLRVPFTAAGDTDSEQAFCDLMNHLWLRFGAQMPRIDVLSDAIKQWADVTAQSGTLNFLLSNGRYLISYCTTDLQWTEREQGLDDVKSDATKPVQIIATKALTVDGDWQAMRKGELCVLSEGKLVLSRDAIRTADSRFMSPIWLAA